MSYYRKYIYGKGRNIDETFCREVLCKYLNTATNITVVGCFKLSKTIDEETANDILRFFNFISEGNNDYKASNTYAGYNGWFLTYNASRGSSAKSGSFYSFLMYLLYNPSTLNYILHEVKEEYWDYNKICYEIIDLIMFHNELDTVSKGDLICMSYYVYSIMTGYSNSIYSKDKNKECTGFSQRGRELLLNDLSNNDIVHIRQFTKLTKVLSINSREYTLFLNVIFKGIKE